MRFVREPSWQNNREDSVPEEIADAEGVETTPPVSDEAPGWVNPSETNDEVAPESTTSDATYKVTVGGEEIEVSLDEALSGYMRQSDYTQKTQTLAQQREELTYAERLAAALEDNPAATLQALQQAYDVQLGTPPAAQATDDSEPLDPEEARIARLEQRLAERDQQDFEQQINSTLTSLHSRFGDFDDVKLMQFAVDRQIPDLEDAVKVFMFDGAVTRKATANQAAQQNKETAPPVAGGRNVATGSVVPGATSERLSLRESLELAQRSLSG